jgi:hypothetical protein
LCSRQDVKRDTYSPALLSLPCEDGSVEEVVVIKGNASTIGSLSEPIVALETLEIYVAVEKVICKVRGKGGEMVLNKPVRRRDVEVQGDGERRR